MVARYFYKKLIASNVIGGQMQLHFLSSGSCKYTDPVSISTSQGLAVYLIQSPSQAVNDIR